MLLNSGLEVLSGKSMLLKFFRHSIVGETELVSIKRKPVKFRSLICHWSQCGFPFYNTITILSSLPQLRGLDTHVVIPRQNNSVAEGGGWSG